jgi:hypothetical protein
MSRCVLLVAGRSSDARLAPRAAAYRTLSTSKTRFPLRLRNRTTCAPQKCHPTDATLDFSTSASSVIRFSGPCSCLTGAPASTEASTRGASRPARISRARAHPTSIDIEVQPWRCVQILREGRVHRVPARCADAHRCSERPTRAGSSGDAPRTSGSSSPDTRAGSCR